MIKVCFINTYKGYQPELSFQFFLLKKIFNESVALVNDVDIADVCFTDAFGDQTSSRHKTIFFSGENVRPNFLKHRFSLSFDMDTWSGRNVYLPLWMGLIAWDGYQRAQEPLGVSEHQNEGLLDLSVLSQPRQLIGNLEKRDFCALIANNPESVRMNLFAIISSYKKITGYGKIFGNPTKETKHTLLNNYYFSLCPENDFYPGYITEKLFHAWYGNCVPIYFGPVELDPAINPKAMLNYARYHNVDLFLSDIMAAHADPSIYMSYFNEPLLLQKPSLNPVLEFLSFAINEILKGE